MTFTCGGRTSNRCRVDVPVPEAVIVGLAAAIRTLPHFDVGFGVEGEVNVCWCSAAGKVGGSPVGVADLMARSPRSSLLLLGSMALHFQGIDRPSPCIF